MKVTWLGQAGLLFEREGVRIIIDPYLSNSVEKTSQRITADSLQMKIFLRSPPM